MRSSRRGQNPDLPGNHDPTRDIAGAPQAYSALTLRLILAGFGFVVCAAGALLFLTAQRLPALGGLLALGAVVALADLVVITRRRRARHVRTDIRQDIAGRSLRR